MPHRCKLVVSAKQTTFGQDKRDTLTQYCRACDVRFARNGGCPKDRFATSPYGESGQHYLCHSYKNFFHIDRPMRIIADLLATSRAPAELMQTYATGDAHRGRNEALHLRQQPQMEALPLAHLLKTAAW